MRIERLAVAVSALCLATCDGAAPPAEAEGGVVCVRDMSVNPSQAVTALLATDIDGAVCPVGDEDYYRVNVAAPNALLTVGIQMRRASGVQPAYAIYRAAEATSAMPRAVATGTPTGVTTMSGGTHCIGSGEYVVRVGDEGNDTQDIRTNYRLRFDAKPEPDAQEPNQMAAMATNVTSGQTTTGYVACVGDVDYYRIDVPANSVLHVRLQSAIAKYEPSLRILTVSGTTEMSVLEQSNLGGTTNATNIDVSRGLPAGTYYIAVRDNDDKHADPDVPYMLLIETFSSMDMNEPNDHPGMGTVVNATPISCGSTPQTFDLRGTIGAPADVDFFAFQITNCDRGLLEAEMTLEPVGTVAEQWESQRTLQATVGLVKPEPRTNCTAGTPTSDNSCRVLTVACDDPWDCAGISNICLPEGRCQGAAFCLPTNTCVVNQVQRNYTSAVVPASPSSPPPPNVAKISTPIMGGSVIYLRATDFQSDAGRPDARYTIRVTIREDPDSNERNEPYASFPVTMDTVPVNESLSFARAAPVHRCPSGDCCGAGNMITGYLSYENDVDWFKYDHPCPGADCMMRVTYQIGAGPSAHRVFIYRGDGQTFASFDAAAGASGSYGGLTAGDQCFYAYQRHPSTYYMSVRSVFDGMRRTYSPEQPYRFCIEVTANSCVAPPCENFSAAEFPDRPGCGQPRP